MTAKLLIFAIICILIIRVLIIFGALLISPSKTKHSLNSKYDESEKLCYINTRLIPQINWFDSKSKECKYRYQCIKTIQIILLASLPFLAGLVGDYRFLVYVIGLIGVILSILEGLLSLKKYHEHWLIYRAKCEFLQKQLNLYIHKVYPYDTDKSNEELIKATESYLENETLNWHFRNGIS